MIKNKYTIFVAIIAMIGFTGCSNPISSHTTPTYSKQTYTKPSATKSANFKNTMTKVALSTKNDANYKKMTLDTPEKKAWFKDLMFRLWDRQITRHQFMAEGLAKYPTHKYEFTFVSNGFQKRS